MVLAGPVGCGKTTLFSILSNALNFMQVSNNLMSFIVPPIYTTNCIAGVISMCVERSSSSVFQFRAGVLKGKGAIYGS